MKPTGLAAAAVCSILMATGSWAAVPNDVAPPPAQRLSNLRVPADYQLDTEMVVRDWVLCTSASSAKRLIEASQVGLAAAQEAYEQLRAAKSCGQFSELRVILRAQLHAASFEAGGDARAFAAMVDLSGSWASAFVISGSLPAE